MILETPQLDSRCDSSSTRLRLLDPLQIDHWDDLLSSHPDATVFHSQGWARVLAETYGYHPLYLAAADAQRLWALLPLFELRSWIKGVRGVSLPFTDACPPLLAPAFDFESLFAAARSLGRERHWNSLELRGAAPEFAPSSLSFYQHQIELGLPEAKLFDGCESSMRRSIRKAERENIRVEALSSIESIDEYYQLHEITRRKHGLPPQPLRFFHNIHRFLIARGLGTVFIARRESKAVAGAVFLHFRKHSVYKFGASDPSAQEWRPNNIALWSGLLRMKALGAESLSFGRTSVHQDGLRRFKRSFGAAETMLHYIKYDYKSAEFCSGASDKSSGLHTHFFRLCPKPVSRLIGTLLYPHVG